jgi:hypothetical protein
MNSSVKSFLGGIFSLYASTLVFLFSSFTLFFYSCQKTSHDRVPSRSQTVEVAANAWLDSKITTATGEHNQRVLQIKQLLDYSKSFTEEAGNGMTFLVIPFKAGLKSAYNNNKNPRNYLLLTEATDGKIKKGNIVQIVSGAPTIPANTFTAMQLLKKVEIDASFTFLSIFDRYLYSISYKNNFITSFTEVSNIRKNASGQTQVAFNSTRTNSTTCVDWFLVTTEYYSDGTFNTYEEFLGTTCTNSGGCLPNEWCEPQPEDSGGGGGGGGSNEVDYEYAKKRTVSWTVYSGPGLYVKSLETVEGKPNNEPTRGTFTAVSHNSSHITGVLIENWSWHESSSFATASGSTASFSVSGTLKYYYSPTGTIYNGSMATTYAECFP